MRLLAGVATGVSVYLLVGALSGRLPQSVPLRRARRWGRAAAAQQWLQQAGAELTVRQFVTGSLVAGAAAFAALAVLIGAPAVAVMPAVAVGVSPWAYFTRRRAARLREVQEAWPDGVRDLLASVSAGLSLHQAVLALARDGPEPLRRAFTRYPHLAPVLGVVPALETVKEELADPTSDRVIEILLLAHERGGQLLNDILRDLADAAVKDLRAREEMRTEALEQRLNAGAVFVLPWLVLLALTAQPGPFRNFYRTAGGVAVVAVGAVLSLAGLWAVAYLGRQPTETRVFGNGNHRGAREVQR